jgi:hypothetical protein
MSLLEKLTEAFMPSRIGNISPLVMLVFSLLFSITIFILPIDYVLIESLLAILLALGMGAPATSLLLFSIMPSCIFLVLGLSTQIFLGSISVQYILNNFLRIVELTSFSIFYARTIDMPKMISLLSRFSTSLGGIAAIVMKLIYEGTWILSELSFILDANSGGTFKGLKGLISKTRLLAKGVAFNVLNDAVYSTEAFISLTPYALRRRKS